MKKLFVGALAGATLVAVTPAAAQDARPMSDNFYLQLDVGASIPADSDLEALGVRATAELDNALMVGGAVGYRITPNVRTELNFSWRNHDVERVTVGDLEFPGDDDFGVMALMYNIYYDAYTGTPVVPYLGAGIGGARFNLESGPLDLTDTVFAWNFMAGASYRFTRQVEVGLGYRFLQTQDPSFDVTVGDVSASLEVSYLTHEVLATIRYNF